MMFALLSLAPTSGGGGERPRESLLLQMSSWPLPIELTELILSRVYDVSNLRPLRDRGKRFLCSPDERESLKAASLVCREWHDIVSPGIFDHSLVKLLHAQAFRDFLMMPSRVHSSVSNLICLEPCSCGFWLLSCSSHNAAALTNDFRREKRDNR